MSEVCPVEGCESGILAKGLCSKHYDRMRKYGSTELPVKTKDDLCVVCHQRMAQYRSDAGGLCQPCYRRQRNADRPRQVGTCTNCGKKFEPTRRFKPDSGRGVFCSRDCKMKYRVTSGQAAVASAKSRYKKQYSLTLDQVDRMRQGGCSICGSEGISGRWGNLHIDHDHTTGAVRGALCHTCNLGVGNFRNDPALLAAAATYLVSPPGPPPVVAG